jgi:quercetin dioxygenase-like cupin family protein
MSFIDLERLEEREMAPGYWGVFLHTGNMTMAYWRVEEGAVMPEHAHPHEQIANVMEGRFELTVAGETRILERGSATVIPPNVPHSGKALTPCRLIDAFHPVREDYR